MKVIFGIDPEGAYKPAVQLFARLRAPKPDVTLVSFMNSVPPFSAVEELASEKLTEEYLKFAESRCRVALDNARDEVCMRDIQSKFELRRGDATLGLIDYADENGADLIAVRAEKRSPWSSTFLGSLTKGLMINAKASLLVAKEPVKEAAPLKVVLATDHSPHSEQWIEKFLSWQLKGITEVHIVTAYDLDPDEADILNRNLPALGGNPNEWIFEKLVQLNQNLEAKFAKAGYTTSARVVKGDVNIAIQTAMAETGSDMLVLGAEGHGFVSRILVGSTSLHQVMAEPYPVLVVR